MLSVINALKVLGQLLNDLNNIIPTNARLMNANNDGSLRLDTN
jgi:hypothetical protein